ncbi:MAG TPA: hypothetical protein VHV47_09495 [Opitutaceae bacterium]|nr:hypothetical protein [Opitutaceae bacterium]
MRPRHDLSPRDLAVWRRLRLTGIGLLVAGLLAGGVVYLRTPPAEDTDIVGYNIVNGVSYPIHRSDDRNYNLQLQQFGGKANVWAYEITHWITTRFQGRRLAYTLAAFGGTCLIACFYASDLFDLPPRQEADV